GVEQLPQARVCQLDLPPRAKCSRGFRILLTRRNQPDATARALAHGAVQPHDVPMTKPDEGDAKHKTYDGSRGRPPQAQRLNQEKPKVRFELTTPALRRMLSGT